MFFCLVIWLVSGFTANLKYHDCVWLQHLSICHIITASLSKMHCNVVFLFPSQAYKWQLIKKCAYLNPVCISCASHPICMPSPPFLPFFSIVTVPGDLCKSHISLFFLTNQTIPSYICSALTVTTDLYKPHISSWSNIHSSCIPSSL